MQKNDNDLLRWGDIHAAIMEYYAETTVSKYGTLEEKNAVRFAVEGTLYAVEDVEPVQTWIPVTERLPDSERWVLAWYKNLNMPGGRTEKAIYMCDDYDPYWRPLERDITEVTHWMELPSTEGLNGT